MKIEEKSQKCIICEIEYEQKDLIDLNLEGSEIEKKKKEILKKQLKKLIEKEGEKTELGNIGEPKKRVKKEDMYVSSLDRLGGEFRDVVRDRSSKLFLIFRIQGTLQP